MRRAEVNFLEEEKDIKAKAKRLKELVTERKQRELERRDTAALNIEIRELKKQIKALRTT